MTIQTGAPDWSVPLAPKVKRLIDSDVTLVGGAATLGPYDCTGYTGILLEHLAITADQSFGLIQVQFQDPQAIIFTVPTYVINWRGDLGIKLNIPVMGPQVTLQYQGTTNGHVSHCSAIAHTGGGAASYGRNATVLASESNAALAAGAFGTVEASLIREGPATLILQPTAQSMQGFVTATDHLGNGIVIAAFVPSSVKGGTLPFWLPPYPVSLNVQNLGSVADGYNAAIVLGRS